MNSTIHPTGSDARLPLVEVLRPREHTLLVVSVGTLSVAVAWWMHSARGWKLWQSVALVLVMMAVPAGVKWRADAKRHGGAVALAGALVVVQVVHSIEHLAQWIQRHVLDWPLRASNGLLSPANAEWVHFVWNWAVLVVVGVLVARGMRGPWAWVLLAWTTLHTLEHTYMWLRYLQVLDQLNEFGFPRVTAQGLPGVVGRDGWLDRDAPAQLAFVCRLPFVTTATRLDTHFGWNAGEAALLVLATNQFLRGRVADPGVRDR